MKKIRSLVASKLKTVSKTLGQTVKPREPKRHIRIGNNRDGYFTSYSYNQPLNVWCGINPIPYADTLIDEAILFSQIREEDVMGRRINYCSCCLNMVQRSIRQRMLGI